MPAIFSRNSLMVRCRVMQCHNMYSKHCRTPAPVTLASMFSRTQTRSTSTGDGHGHPPPRTLRTLRRKVRRRPCSIWDDTSMPPKAIRVPTRRRDPHRPAPIDASTAHRARNPCPAHRRRKLVTATSTCAETTSQRGCSTRRWVFLIRAHPPALGRRQSTSRCGPSYQLGLRSGCRSWGLDHRCVPPPRLDRRAHGTDRAAERAARRWLGERSDNWASCSASTSRPWS